MQTLSQRDPKWGEVTIGHSTSKIKDYGCTICCLASLAGTTPDVVNAYLTVVGGFSVDRIIWSKINETKLGLHFPDMGRQYVYNDVAVREAIEKNGGCLVEVDFDGIISTPNDRHWVLFIGDGKAYDPWTGTEILTTKYQILKGYCIINKLLISEEQMISEEQKRILDFIGTRTEGDVREAFGSLADASGKEEQIRILNEQVSLLKEKILELSSTVDTLNDRIVEYGKDNDNWQRDFMTANEKLTKALEDLDKITTDRNDYRRRYEALLEKSVDKLSGLELIIQGIKKLFIKKL